MSLLGAIIIAFGIGFLAFALVGRLRMMMLSARAYNISATVSFLMLLFSIFIILNQFILALILFVAIPILSIAGLPNIIKAMK